MENDSWKLKIENERAQKMPPPQNRLIWHIDYFELKALKEKQMPKKTSDLPLSS